MLLVLLPLLAVQAPAAAPPTKPIAIPGTFEENRGQADPRVRFFSRRSNYTVFLTSEGAVFSLARDSGKRRAAVRLSFVGGRRDAVVVPELPLVAKTNYFKGADPSRWQTGIPNYGRVRLRGIRPGVDVLFYLRDNELEYDLVVRPGTDPDRVRVRFEGQESMAVDGAGDLVLETAAGRLVAHKPHVWQKADGKRREVPARYVLTRLQGDTVPAGELRPHAAAHHRSRHQLLDLRTDHGSGNRGGHGLELST